MIRLPPRSTLSYTLFPYTTRFRSCIVSTGSLIVGGAASGTDQAGILVAGIAALVAGAMSMAAGEYVSVSSQADTEQAELAREKAELATQPGFERQELAEIYTSRGLEPELALTVADQIRACDSLGQQSPEELGACDILQGGPPPT